MSVLHVIHKSATALFKKKKIIGCAKFIGAGFFSDLWLKFLLSLLQRILQVLTELHV